MKKSMLSLAASTCLVALLGAAAPAHAAFITFVSGNGLDSNNCPTPATACRQLAGASGAISKTDATGTIHVLAGEYSAFAIDKSLDVLAEPGTATIADSTFIAIPGGGSASILVSDLNIVRIQGFHVYNPYAGIAFVGGGKLYVERCVFVPGSSQFGVDHRPNGTSELYVSDTILSGDGSAGGGGISIRPTGSGSAKAVLDDVNVEDNASGIIIDGRSTTGTNTVTIRNSVVSGGSAFGIYAVDGGGGVTNVTVEGSTSTNNTTFGIGSNGVNSFVRVRNSTVNGNGTGLQIAGSGKLISNGGNVVRGNTANGAFTATEAQQ